MCSARDNSDWSNYNVDRDIARDAFVEAMARLPEQSDRHIPSVYYDWGLTVVAMVPDRGVVHLEKGRAHIVVLGDVGHGAVVYACGGDSAITILGDVNSNSHIIGSGGNTKIIIHGDVKANATLIASGASAYIGVFGDASKSATIIFDGASTTQHTPHMVEE